MPSNDEINKEINFDSDKIDLRRLEDSKIKNNEYLKNQKRNNLNKQLQALKFKLEKVADGLFGIQVKFYFYIL